MHHRAVIALLALSLLGWSPATQLGGGTPAVVSGCSTNIPLDDFSSGSIGVEWNEAGQDIHANCPWTIGSGVLTWNVNNNSNCDNDNALALNASSAGGADQWACGTFVQVSGPIDAPGVVLRAATSTESTAWYSIVAAIGTTTVTFSLTEEAAADTDASCGEQFDATDELCAHITGTGASTSVDVWINPSGSTPDDFGAADCTLAANLSNDTGNFVGFRAVAGATSNGDFIEFDDFRGGSCN